MVVKCSNCGETVKEICSTCWRCYKCCDCVPKMNRKINGTISKKEQKKK